MATPTTPPATRILPALMSPDASPQGTTGANGIAPPTGVERVLPPYNKIKGTELIFAWNPNVLPGSELEVKAEPVMFINGQLMQPSPPLIFPKITLSTTADTIFDLPYQNNVNNIMGVQLDPVYKISATVSINGRIYCYLRAYYLIWAP